MIIGIMFFRWRMLHTSRRSSGIQG